MNQLSLLDRVEKIVETSIPQSHIYILNIAKCETESLFAMQNCVPKHRSHLSISLEESGISIPLFEYISNSLVTVLHTNHKEITIDKNKTIKRVVDLAIRELNIALPSQANFKKNSRVYFDNMSQTDNRDMLNAILLVFESHMNNHICSKTMLQICKALSEKYGVGRS